MKFFPNLADLAASAAAGEWTNVRYIDSWALRGDRADGDGTFFTLNEENNTLTIVNEDDAMTFQCYLPEHFRIPFRRALRPINSPEDC